VPVELDQIYAALDKLNLALGPNGANKDGRAQRRAPGRRGEPQGNGQLLGTTLEDFSTFVTTLSEQREDLFGTVANLQDFTTTIANSDQTVRAFNRDLAQVSEQLEAEREDLARAVRELSVALGEVATFVQANRADLKANVSNLKTVTDVLVKQQNAPQGVHRRGPHRPVEPPARLQPVRPARSDTRDNNVEGAESDPSARSAGSSSRSARRSRSARAWSDDPVPAGSASAGPAPAPAAPKAPVARDMTLGGILDGGR
jgi:hypothetical protein